jgi:hypothetical protein
MAVQFWLKVSFWVVLVLLATPGASALDPLPAACWPATEEASIISREEFPFCRLLDRNYALHWVVRDEVVHFAIFVSGTYNFVGLGITEGGLSGADLWTARADDAQPWLANPWHVEDFFSSNGTLTLDSSQDVSMDMVEQAQTYTYVALSRHLDTCDRDQDLKIYNDTDVTILFAYGAAYSPSMWQDAPSVQAREPCIERERQAHNLCATCIPPPCMHAC